MIDADLRGQRLEEIIRLCREEAGRPRGQECGHCFELFRRAIEARDQAAWTAIEAQYHRLMLTWLPAADGPNEADLLAREAMARFWQTLAGVDPLRDRFGHVGALLRYLRQCTISALLDRERQARRVSRLRERLERSELPAAASEEAPEAEGQEQRLEQVRAWVRENVTDPVELLVLELSYEKDLSPAEIAARHPERFADVQTVRRIKERILRRVKRALEETG